MFCVFTFCSKASDLLNIFYQRLQDVTFCNLILNDTRELIFLRSSGILFQRDTVLGKNEFLGRLQPYFGLINCFVGCISINGTINLTTHFGFESLQMDWCIFIHHMMHDL